MGRWRCNVYVFESRTQRVTAIARTRSFKDGIQKSGGQVYLLKHIHSFIVKAGEGLSTIISGVAWVEYYQL
jgi:hypothetical protein